MKRHLLPYLGPIKEAGWVSAGQVVAFLGGLIGIKILTNIMSPQNYGELALGVSVAGVCNLFLFGPLGQVVLRFYSSCRERGNLEGYARVLIRLHEQAIFFLGVIGLPASILVGAVFGLKWGLLLGLSLLFGILSGVQGSLTSLLNALRDRKMTALTQALDPWLRLGLAVVLVAGIDSQGKWALMGYLMGSLAVLVVQARAVRLHGFRKEAPLVDRAGDDRALRGDFVAYGMPFLAFSGLAAISQYADRWMLQGFWGEDAVGVYAAMFQIASAPIVFLMGVATQLIIPVVFARSGNLDDHRRARSGRHLLAHSVMVMFVLYAVIVLVAFVWGKSLVTLLTNMDYARQADAFWVMVLSQAVFNLAQLMVASGLSLNRSGPYFFPKLGQALSLIVAGLIFVQGGVDGMANAVLVSSVIYLLWVSKVNHGLWKVHVEAK